MRFIIYFILLIISITASADNAKLSQKQFKKDIANVKGNIKKGRDLENGERTLRKYLADSLYSQDKDLHLMLVECLRKQYEAANEKMYLKERVDTASVVRTNLRMFLAIEAFDSIDALPNRKGVVAPSYRKKHAEFLMPYWGNILKGGVFFFAHNNWKEAWQSLDVYLDSFRQPLFSGEKLDSTYFYSAAYLATMSGYNLSDIDKAQKYADEAVQYAPQREMALQKLADICNAKGDTACFVNYLRTGFYDYPYSDYFFPSLVDYYTQRGDYAQAFHYADEAYALDSVNTVFLLARHNVLMQMHRYDEALANGESLLHISDSLAIPNYNVAYIYYRKAQDELGRADVPLRQRMKNAQAYFKASLPYMERYRALRPGDIQHWQPVLYEAYLNLNMGKEFESLPALSSK